MTRARITPDGWQWQSIRALGGGSPTTVQTGPFGVQLHASDYVEDGVPLLLIRNLKDGRLDLSDIPQISEEDASRLARYRLQDGDIVFSRVGRVGSCFLASEGHAGWLISGQLLRVRLSANAIERQYLFRALTGRYAQDHIAGASVGTTRTSINTQILESLDLLVPDDKREQIKIAEVLSTVDRAIDQTEVLMAKQQRIKTGLMRDLLTRGIDEHGNLRSEQTHEFKHSPLGRIPVEWDVATVDQVARITTGDKDTQDADPTAEYPFFVRSRTIERISSYSFDGEAVLTAGDGVGTGKVFHYFNGRFDFHQRVYCVHSFAEDMLGYFFFCHFQTHFMERVAQFSAKGSVDSVRRHMIAKMLVPKPSLDEQARIAIIMRSLEKSSHDHTLALQKLRHLKVALMADLLTGERRVTPLLEPDVVTA